MHRALVPAILLAAVACGPTASTTGDGIGSGDGGTTSTSASTGTTATSTGLPTSGSTGQPTCPPLVPETITADFSIAPEPPMGTTRYSCVVLDVTNEATQTTVELTCGGPPDVDTFPVTYGSLVHTPPALAPDDAVVLTTGFALPWWADRWFALHEPDDAGGALVAAGVSGSDLDPPDTDLGAFLGTVTVTEVHGLCPFEPDAEGCGDNQRLGLDLAAGGETARLVAPGEAYAGGYALLAERAVVYQEPLDCFDFPSRWYQFVVERLP